MKSVTIKLTSCLQCINSGYEHDPSSDDSFDWHDSALVCKATKPSKEELASRIVHKGEESGRIIVGGSRNPEREYTQLKLGIPDWCPLAKPRK